jgi:thioredoxin reductase
MACNIVVGGGPGGLNLALELQLRNIPYVLLEGSEKVGGQFDRFPRCNELISLNKKHVLWDNFEYARRYDWHTLNGITQSDAQNNPKLLFTNWSNDLFPKARTYAEYLRYVADHYKLNIVYNSKVEQVSRREDGQLEVQTTDGRNLLAKRLFLATGTSHPNIPDVIGIEKYGVFYQDFDPTQIEKYRNKSVVIMGGGNSAFELAHSLLSVAGVITILSRSGYRYARQTHNVHDIRTQWAVVYDLAQLKSQMNVISDRVTEVRKLEDGRLLLKTRTPQPHWDPPQWSVRDLICDEILVCTGWNYTLNIFNQNVKPEISPCGHYYALSHTWESVNEENIFFVGAHMRVNDKDAASGFIHGFRCNVTALASVVAERFHGTPLAPLHVSDLDLQNDDTFLPLAKFMCEFVSQSASLFELFQYFCSPITFHGTGPGTYQAYVWPPLPRAYAEERWSKDPSVVSRIETIFQYGFSQYGDLSTHLFTHAGDHFQPSKSAYIHPVFHVYGKLDKTSKSQWHCQESLVARWDQDDYCDSGTNNDQHVNTVFNAIAEALGHAARRDTRPVTPESMATAYIPMTPDQVRQTLQEEPGMKYFMKDRSWLNTSVM